MHKGRVPAAYRGKPQPKTRQRYAEMESGDKARMVAGWLEDKLGRRVLALDVKNLSNISEAAILVSAENSRHAQALADHVLDQAKEANIEFLRMEGYRHGRWILLDMNDLVVHLFQDEDRDFFNLEGLWPKAPVIYEGTDDEPDDEFDDFPDDDFPDKEDDGEPI